MKIFSHRSNTSVVGSFDVLGSLVFVIMAVPHCHPVYPTLQTQVLEVHIPFELQK